MKLMVIDTQGPDGLSDAYRAALPGITIRGIQLAAQVGQRCTPHGAWCGYLAAAPLAAQGIAAELVFVRCFDGRDRWTADEEWLLDVIGREKPDYVSRSWGAWHGGDQVNRIRAAESFRKFTAGYRVMLESTEIADFGASGNNDDNNARDDVVYPQAGLKDLCVIVGAARRDGVPCRWSADGAGVLLVMWGDGVASPDGSGTWSRWSGTSAACPKACGAAAALSMTGRGFLDFVRAKATRPAEWTGPLPHPKWGWGNGEEFWQVQMRGAPADVLPPGGIATVRTAAMDYRRVSRRRQHACRMLKNEPRKP